MVLMSPLLMGFQKFKPIMSIDEVETIAKNSQQHAFSIAYLSAGVIAVFALTKLWKGMHEGNNESSKAARGWLTAFFFYLFGIFLIQKFIAQ